MKIVVNVAKKTDTTKFSPGDVLLYNGSEWYVTTKEELLKEVWELEPDSDTSFLWSTIYRLKKKIAPYQDRFYIESDHSGYELVVIEKGSN